MEKVYFAAGCFWGVQKSFKDLQGVTNTSVGYIGGQKENPTYEEVCTDKTGHAEAVEVEFDPTQISFEKLTRFFFKLHDPTTLNRQGPDIGSQYRSAIFTTTPEQLKLAETLVENLKSDYSQPIVTVIEMAISYYKAEEYHQDYVCKRSLK